jgi:FkbM family methyltransferase
MDAVEILKLIGSQRQVRFGSAIFGAALPHAALTYAQGGEDMALFRILKKQVLDGVPKVYVDVGCGDPFQNSNSLLFYCFGWRGLCVDANDQHQAAWEKHRPRDKFICSAIGVNECSALLFRSNSANWGLAQIAPQSPGDGYHPGIPVPVQRLDSLFEANLGNEDIAFMSIDVEGMESEVLTSNNWMRWRPRVILMECHGFNFDAPYSEPSIKHLRDRGYHLEEKIGANVLMVRSD